MEPRDGPARTPTPSHCPSNIPMSDTLSDIEAPRSFPRKGVGVKKSRVPGVQNISGPIFRRPNSPRVAGFFIERFSDMSRAHIQNLLTALDASPRALRRDQCGDQAIIGRSGHVYANGAGFALYIQTGESARRWNNIKRRLEFCRVVQDGDSEGVLALDRLPTPSEAEFIRDAVGIRRRRHISPGEQARLAGLTRIRKGSVKTASGAPGSRQDDRGASMPASEFPTKKAA